MALSLVTNAVASIGGLITGVMNYITDMFLTAPLKATLRHLEETELQTLTGGLSAFVFTHQRSYWLLIYCSNWCVAVWKWAFCLEEIRLLLNSSTLLPHFATQRKETWKPSLCGTSLELSSWQWDDPDDFCAERYAPLHCHALWNSWL